MSDILRQRVHVSVAIEGNTNSSFLAELGGIHGPDRVLVYRLAEKRFIRLSDLSSSPAQSLLKMGKELLGSAPFFNSAGAENEPLKVQGERFTRRELPPETAAVHGYFTPNLFKGIIENPFISIILKDPLERLIDLYEHWTAARGEVSWRVSIPFKNKLPFRDFALHEKLVNYQSKCLGNRRLGDFDLVGVADCQEGFIAQLQNKDWLGFVGNHNHQPDFSKPRYRNLGVTPEFRSEFREANELDYTIYELAKEFMGLC